MSDHLPSIVSLKNLKLSKKEPVKVTSRDTLPKNLKALQNSLSSVWWTELFEENSPDTNMSKFHD